MRFYKTKADGNPWASVGGYFVFIDHRAEVKKKNRTPIIQAKSHPQIPSCFAKSLAIAIATNISKNEHTPKKILTIFSNILKILTYIIHHNTLFCQ